MFKGKRIPIPLVILIVTFVFFVDRCSERIDEANEINSWIQEVVENNKENLDTSNEESLDTRDPLELQHSNKNTVFSFHFFETRLRDDISFQERSQGSAKRDLMDTPRSPGSAQRDHMHNPAKPRERAARP
ncbi:hypothetical protein M8J77_012849 [Diaphorina citri]|nr:hypothetical protein M8J77_012849 [Diaphorina citri]